MTPAQRGQLALLLEVCGTPKPGNVDRHHDYPDLRFEHFLAGAIGAYNGLVTAANGGALGSAFEDAICGMSQQTGGNTQFGALLLITPMVRTAADGDIAPDAITDVVERTTVEDAANFYRAFEHVDVAVADPPDAYEDLDVRRGSGAIEAIETRGLTLYDVMELSAPVDGVAREWTTGFDRSFDAGARLLEGDGPVPDRTARVFLELLADEPDTFIEKTHDEATATEATRRARLARDGEIHPSDLAAEFIEREINPGTTADIVAGGLFIALDRGLGI